MYEVNIHTDLPRTCTTVVPRPSHAQESLVALLEGSPAVQQVLRYYFCARVHAFPALSLRRPPGLAVGGENTPKHLRQALPAFVEDHQLREALARCEVIIRAGEVAGMGQVPETTRFVGNECAGVFVGLSANWMDRSTSR